LASSFVGWVLFRQAVNVVEEKLATPLWTLPTIVQSGPTSLWVGLKTSEAELKEILKASGYGEVNQVNRPGSFSINQGRFHLFGLPRTPNGFDNRQAYIQIQDGRIEQIDGPSPLHLASVRLATMGGASSPDADSEMRTPRKLEDFPSHLKNAVLSMEDADFWEHGGVSFTGILRALAANVRGRRQGGSTITQQLAKNLFLNADRSLERKFNELFFALALEDQLSKEEILAMYLNEIYWGQANGMALCGAESAAKTYFGKPVEKLTLGESALLAGVISAPNTYSPLRSPERALERRSLALKRMEKEGYITAKEAYQARNETLRVLPARGSRNSPYAVDAALEWTEKKLGAGVLGQSGLRIETTLHPLLQKRAEEAVAESLKELRKRVPDAQMALLALDPSDGRILAMVGGSDYRETSFNRALLAKRQLGSTVKPLTLMGVFEKDPTLSPATFIEDKAIQRDGPTGVWEPTNYDGQFKGTMTLREAVATSRNIPAVLMAERLGYKNLQALLHKVGLSDAHSLPSTSLGAFEASPLALARAYSVFVNGGALPEPRLVEQVSLPTHEGSQAALEPVWEVLLEIMPQSEQVVSARAAALARSVLESVLTGGSGKRAQSYGVGPAAGGKTGTTNEARDAWFVGVSPTLSVAVWAGRDSGSPLGVPGSKAALPAWSRFMAASGTTDGRFRNPPNVVSAETCEGEWSLGDCNSCGLELYSADHAPQGGCGVRGYFWDLKRRWEPIVDGEDLQDVVQDKIRSQLLPF
jgi:penicillin-binding protein 1B